MTSATSPLRSSALILVAAAALLAGCGSGSRSKWGIVERVLARKPG